MGVLDDAIREHLELKRRHGAPEEDLRRQEEEALGPARREVAPADADEDGDGAGEQAPAEIEAAETAPADLPAEAGLDGEHTEDETALHEPPSEELEAVEEPPVAAHHEEALDERDAPAVAPFDEQAELDEDPAEGDTPARGFETLDDDPDVGELAEDELLDEEGDPSDGDADVLEDTPDFLQETPEHDRLWFEQKPPRDFDFD